MERVDGTSRIPRWLTGHRGSPSVWRLAQRRLWQLLNRFSNKRGLDDDSQAQSMSDLAIAVNHRHLFIQEMLAVHESQDQSNIIRFVVGTTRACLCQEDWSPAVSFKRVHAQHESLVNG